MWHFHFDWMGLLFHLIEKKTKTEKYFICKWLTFRSYSFLQMLYTYISKGDISFVASVMLQLFLMRCTHLNKKDSNCDISSFPKNEKKLNKLWLHICKSASFLIWAIRMSTNTPKKVIVLTGGENANFIVPIVLIGPSLTLVVLGP